MIKRRGGPEEMYAEKKYKEAVAEALEKCAADTKGQTCYICTQALHWKTKEGLVRGCSCRGTAGFAHVSCLAEQAKILVAEAEENNLGGKAVHSRYQRWYACSLCEQHYYGVVFCALGWACWKTYVGRHEGDWARRSAMNILGGGLDDAGHHEDALPVREAELAMMRRLGASEVSILAAQNNLANSYYTLKRFEEAVCLRREVYSGRLKLSGEERRETLGAAVNYAALLKKLNRFEEARSLMRKTIPVAQRVLGESHDLTLKMRMTYAQSLYEDDDTTLDHLREAVRTLEEIERTARRVFGGTHPTTGLIYHYLRDARAALRARETPSPSNNA